VIVISDTILHATPYPMRRFAIRLLKAMDARLRRRVDSKSLLIPLPDLWHCDPVLFWRPSWSTEIFRVLLQMRPGAFIDIGANMGQTMLDLLFIEPSRTYVGFEPNPVCAGYLSQLVAENEFSNLTVIASALGQEATLRALHLQRGRVIDDAATLVTEVRPNRAYFEQLVPTWPLDNIYHKCSAESPAVVVVDVEGAELEVLRGMAELLKSERPPVVCEVLFTDKRADLSFMKSRNDEMAALLNEIKYAIFQIVKHMVQHRSLTLECCRHCLTNILMMIISITAIIFLRQSR
jgi:FkbM family methyltransferase